MENSHCAKRPNPRQLKIPSKLGYGARGVGRVKSGSGGGIGLGLQRLCQHHLEAVLVALKDKIMIIIMIIISYIFFSKPKHLAYWHHVFL